MSSDLDARDALRKNVVLERIEDGSGPPLAGAGVVAGGTSVYRDQAACPFRAFAMHRLGARGLDASSALNASDRGTLVHALLSKIWRELKSSSALEALSERDLRVLVNAAADAAVNGLRWQRPDALGGRLAQLEQARLARLALEWLELEKQRPPFEIAAIEAKQAITVAGLTVNARLDRMDRLLEGTEGAWAVIDYKTGRADAGAWLGERPDEPQLPLYAVGAARSTGAPEGVVALAFAQVRSGAMEFRGLSARADMIPGVLTVEKHRSQAARAYANWEAVLDGLRRELDALAREFVRGEARVSPKHGAASCRLCELHGLCRISEREGRSPQDDDEASADFGESA